MLAMMNPQAREKAQWHLRSEPQSEQANPAAPLSPGQIQDLGLAAAQMTGAAWRAFQAEMTLKYGCGSARVAETRLGWSRERVEVGLGERRTGIACLSAHAAWRGRNRWEEKYPEAARALRGRAEAPAQQAPTVRTPLAYPRLPATAAREALRAPGSAESALPAPSTMAEVVTRLG